MNSNGVLLEVNDLKLHFRTRKGPVQAVDGVSFALQRGKTLAIVGESGCGKTSLTKAILRLLPRNIMTYSGEIKLNGVDLMKMSDEQYRREIRWKRVATVPQASMNSLNPVLRIQDQIIEPLLLHNRKMTRSEALKKAAQTFEIVGLSTDFLPRYPFELSGGMRQRATIAMALVTDPELVILDEPSSALDLLTQANLMNVLKQIKIDFGTTFILITHDIGTASELADQVAVMYAGQLIEWCDAERFYTNARHPYSQKLMASVPTLREDKDLTFIPGQPPSLINPPTGCRFAERCEFRHERCVNDPPTTHLANGQHVRCWLHVEVEEKKNA